MAARQLTVGDGHNAVGIGRQLVQGDLVIRAQHVAQKVHDERIVPLQFLIHSKMPPWVWAVLRAEPNSSTFYMIALSAANFYCFR